MTQLVPQEQRSCEPRITIGNQQYFQECEKEEEKNSSNLNFFFHKSVLGNLRVKEQKAMLLAI